MPEEPPEDPEPIFALPPGEGTVTLGEDFPSEFAVLATPETGEIPAEKGSDVLLFPTSMTKIPPLLVAAELGLSEGPRFTNCVGPYAPEHRCTARDMALVLRAAMENQLCREVLTTKRFHTAATAFHPEGQDLSNWFLRRIEDKDCGNAEVLAAKTGYVAKSGSCAASFAQDAEGRGYLCVTGNAHRAWRAIYDHAEVYSRYIQRGESSGGENGKAAGQLSYRVKSFSWRVSVFRAAGRGGSRRRGS